MSSQALTHTPSGAIMAAANAGAFTEAETTRKPVRKTGKVVFISALLGLSIAAEGARKLRAAGAAPAPVAAQQIPSVDVSKPMQRALEKRHTFTGQFAAIEQVELRAQVGGTLTHIHFKDGDIVHQGDVLFTIDPTPYEIKHSQAQAHLESTQAKLELANRQLERAHVLRKSDAGTAENVDQRQADAKAAQAAVEEAKTLVRDAKFDLDRTQITAPFTGRIGTHKVSIGNLISGSRAGSGPTTLLTTLVSLDPVHLNFDMSEQDYLHFARNRSGNKGALASKAHVALSDESSFSREGLLDFVDNAIDRSSGTIHARATIPNKDLMITAGAFGRVRLELSAPASSLLVPDASVLPDQSSHMVMTVGQDGVVKPKTVEVGELRGGLRVIRSGLDAEDQVIVSGIPSASPGAKVNAVITQIQFNSAQD